jgi:hypothetical protein
MEQEHIRGDIQEHTASEQHILDAVSEHLLDAVIIHHCVKTKKVSYVRARRLEALQSQRKYKKEGARREARDMPKTPPPPEEVEESESRPRITQLWWLEHELTAVHTNLEQALVELRRLMTTMNSVHTHEVAILNEDKETVAMIRIQSGMAVCPMSTKALIMAMAVRPCVTNGEKIFEESEAVEWKDEMHEWTWAHKERMELVHQARVVETDEAAREGGVFVAACTPRLVKTTHQARMVGKDMLMWLAKECVISRLRPKGMVPGYYPRFRTEEHVQTIVDHWLEHGELSTVGKRTVAQGRNNHTQQRDRDERDHPWMAVITMSSEMMTTGKRLGKAVGQEMLSFQRRDAPLEIQTRCAIRSEPGG